MEEFWLSSTPLSSPSKIERLVKHGSDNTWPSKCGLNGKAKNKQGGADIKAKYEKI